MAKKRLTDRTLRTLKPAQLGRRYDIMDADVPGLGVRVTDKRQRTFVLVTRYPGSRNPTRRALGEYPLLTLDAAHKKARRWQELIRQHIDPKDEEERLRLAEVRKRANAFDVVAEEFIKRVLIGPDPKKPRQRRGHIVARELRREFSNRWQGRPISSIMRRDVIGIINEVLDRGASAQAFKKLIQRAEVCTTARNLPAHSSRARRLIQAISLSCISKPRRAAAPLLSGPERFPHPTSSWTSRTVWSDYGFLNALVGGPNQNTVKRDLDLRVEQMKKRNERPRGGLRTAAKAAMAEEHGITVRTLENRMQRLPIPRKKTG